MKQLQTWEEITGTLQDVGEGSRGVKVTIDGTSIILDDKSNNGLRQAVGKEVSILRTDVEHRIRVKGDK